MLIIEKTRNVSEIARHYGLKVHEMSGKSEELCQQRDADGYDLYQTYNSVDNSTLAWSWRRRRHHGG